jgi:hypothetical protein
MAFPKWSSAFGSSSMPSIADSFSGKFDFGKTLGLDSSKEIGGLGSKSTGMAFDPLTLGLGAAGIGASLFGANAANQTRANMANAQMAAAADQLKWQTMLGREQAKGQMGAELGSRIFQSTVAPDLEFGRQKKRRCLLRVPLGERQLALDTERERRKLTLVNQLMFENQRQRENKEALKRTFAEKQAQMAGVFGRIAPQDVSTYFV